MMRSHRSLLFNVFLLCSLWTAVFTYRPVVLMHGINDNAGTFGTLIAFIEKFHPGTPIFDIDMFDNKESLISLPFQSSKVLDAIANFSSYHNATELNFICYSQGGMVCRGAIEAGSSIKVRNFISLSSPQGGQYGETEMTHYLFSTYVTENLYKIFYTKVGQEISIGNFWNDPHHQDLYLSTNTFLPYINNEVPHNSSATYWGNFARMNRLVTIGGPDDEVITPWQAAHFQKYDHNEQVVDIQDIEWYEEDSFGLRTLDKKGSWVRYSIAGVHHTSWHVNQTVFDCCIAPHLD